MNTTRRQLLAQRAENMRNQMTYPERGFGFRSYENILHRS